MPKGHGRLEINLSKQMTNRETNLSEIGDLAPIRPPEESGVSRVHAPDEKAARPHLRILMATPAPRRREGGASAVILELGQQLKSFGHEVDLLFLDDVPGGRVLSARLQGLYFSIGVARHILRNPRRYDVVNLRAPSGLIYGLMRSVRRRRNCPPYLVELDGLEERRMYVLKQEAKKGRAWNFTWKNRLWQRFYHLSSFRIATRTADWAVCATREIWSYVQLVYGLNYERVTYLPHAVGDAFFQERVYPHLSSPRLLFVGTWLEQRGTRYIAQALEALVKELPGIRLTIAGSALAPDVTLESFPVSIRGSVDVIPFVPSDQMPSIYASHDIFLFPSFFEALPLVLLEAMAAGMPVITAESCGMMDAVRDDWNGLLVPPGNADAIIRAVMMLAVSPELCKRLGVAARESASWFKWEAIGRRLEEVLYSLKSQEPSRPSEAILGPSAPG
jgi:glycosyltransferase involved in cell wall biosynthesis